MKVVREVEELRRAVRDARQRGQRVGLVPTMGAFHDGHLSLIARARSCCDLVVVSLFVNPAQFNELADLERYPRDEERDASLAGHAGADILFAPAVSAVYPAGFSTTVEVSGVSAPLEGVVRGTQHFRGVATVVAKLFNMVQPHDAFFGQKDAQQALLIRRMARDLDFPVRIEVCPTVREPDGLAMSSRNVLLDAESRSRAPVLYEALRGVASSVAAGERDAATLLAAASARLAARGVSAEYLAIVSAETLEPVATVQGEVLVAVAARFGSVRLIDNVLASPSREVA